MKYPFLAILLLLCCQRAFSAHPYDNSLQDLNKILERKQQIDAQKIKRIDRLKELVKNNYSSPLNKYLLYLELYNEYKSFNYVEAFNNAKKLQQTAYILKDHEKIAYGKIKMGFILLSSGMFKEAFDSLKTVNIQLLSVDEKKEYFFLTARTYYDLADFDSDTYFAAIYNKQAGDYTDSATLLGAANSFEYLYYNGLKYLKNGNTPRAVQNLNSLIDRHGLTDHQYAITASTLSDIYIRSNQPDKAIGLLAKAAMADIRSSTKEAAAMLNLAQLLYKQGDEDNAYSYIKQAMEDANYYGARQRKLQVSAILPVIAGQRIIDEEGKKRAWLFYGALITFVLVVIIVFSAIVYKQLQKLKLADKLILETNSNLKESLNKLNEAEKIKEEYIGYYFNLIAEYINKLDKFKRSVDNKLTTKKFEDIRVLINNINLTKEREELFINFDKAFLKIFPNFVTEFNSYFDEANHVKLLSGQLLNTDMRIFALIRLGITDTEKIASILEYSINTIYNYKARIKNRSTLPNDDFEKAIMAIKAV